MGVSLGGIMGKDDRDYKIIKLSLVMSITKLVVLFQV